MNQSLRLWRGLWLSGMVVVLAGIITPLRAGNLPDTTRTSHPAHSLITRKLLVSTAVAVGSLGLGASFTSSIDVVHRDPLIGAPSRLDRFFRDRLHDRERTTNFLDSGPHGSLVAVGGVAAMVLLEHCIDDQSTWKETTHELAVFGVGALTEQGFKFTVKTTVARHRPRLEFAPPASFATLNARQSNHQSFYSGHASITFYTAAYVDQKVGDLLRPRMKGRARLLYRTLSLTSLYGWAAYVSYSRIQIDRHYFTDVAAGGVIGAAWGVWHYRYHHGKDGRWAVVPALAKERVGITVILPH